MGKRLDIGDRSYRRRRGQWVRIPNEWVGHVPNPQTIRKRNSKKPKRSVNNNTKINKRDFSRGKYQRYKRGEAVFGDEYE